LQFVFVFTEFRGAQAGVPLFFAEKVLKHVQGSQRAINEDAGPNLPFDCVNSVNCAQSDPGFPSRQASQATVARPSSKETFSTSITSNILDSSVKTSESSKDPESEISLDLSQSSRGRQQPLARRDAGVLFGRNAGVQTESFLEVEVESSASELRMRRRQLWDQSMRKSSSMRTYEIGLTDTSVQTVSMSSAEVGVQVGSARPPPMPRSLGLQRRRAVNLRTRKLVMREFQETPNQTVAQLLLAILLQINPRGKGCCYMHVGLEVLQEGWHSAPLSKS